MMCRFWSTNKGGYCLAPTCHLVQEDLEHLLVVCPALDHVRHRLHSLWCLKTADCPPLQRLIMWILGSSPDKQVRLILDSTACPQLISLVQAFGQEIQDRVCYLTRTWAFSIHCHKMKILGRWPENVRTNGKKTRPFTLPSPNNPNRNVDNDHLTLNTSNSLSNNLITNVDIFPALMTQPQCTTTLLPASTTTLPTGSTAPHPYRSSSTSPASNTLLVPYDVELFVHSEPTSVQSDQPPDAMPGPATSIRISNLSPSVKCVVGLDKNLTGHGRGHRVMDCGPSSVAGHQHPESPNMPVSLSVSPIVKTVARAVSLSLD
jgi:hypothetical protein